MNGKIAVFAPYIFGIFKNVSESGALKSYVTIDFFHIMLYNFYIYGLIFAIPHDRDLLRRIY